MIVDIVFTIFILVNITMLCVVIYTRRITGDNPYKHDR